MANKNASRRSRGAPPAEGQALVQTWVPNEIRDVIDQQAKRSFMSRAGYLLKVLTEHVQTLQTKEP